MSNRAEVQINGVYIYTHLGGSNVKQRVAAAIDTARDRWEQPDYVTRAIVDEMEKDATGETTGIGISSTPYGALPRIEILPRVNKIYVLDFDGVEETYHSPVEFVGEYLKTAQERGPDD